MFQIQTISRQIRKSNKLFVLVIPPVVYHKDQKGFFDADDFNNLVDNVDFFSLMTYDYSTPQRPGNFIIKIILSYKTNLDFLFYLVKLHHCLKSCLKISHDNVLQL